jgi:predicted extracellular nuclease
MSDERSLGLRRASFAALPGIFKDNEVRTRDPDLLLLGDLNTMGCQTCVPPITAAQEIESAARSLLQGGLRLVPADAPGSHFHDGQATLLDHAVAALRMRELDPKAQSRVLGACGADAPGPGQGIAKKVRRRLSDHCPIVLDLTDRDLD